MKEFDHIVRTIFIFVLDLGMIFSLVLGAFALLCLALKFGEEGRKAAGWTDPKNPPR